METQENKCTHCKSGTPALKLFILGKRVALCNQCADHKSIRDIIYRKQLTNQEQEKLKLITEISDLEEIIVTEGHYNYDYDSTKDRAKLKALKDKLKNQG